jgi:starvation-inducible DNA-binding protein
MVNKPMDELIDQMKVVLADTFAMYLKAHMFHWNVTGPNFPQLHDFFGDLYAELHGAVDPIAEQIRTLDAFAPGSFKRFSDLATVEDETSIPAAMSMVSKLQEDNEKIIETLKKAYRLSEAADTLGLSNFLQDRIDIHWKHNWMLKAILKG